MSTIGTVSTEQPTPAPSLSHGDLVFVYNGPGLVTRLEGWALSLIEMMFGDGPDATIRRKVAVYRNADGSLDISARVSRLAAVESAWHLVNPAGDIVNGGPRGRHGEKPSQTAEELEAERDSGKYKSHEGSVPVYGIPSTAQRSPSADTEWVREVRTEATFRAARGGMYRWYEPDAAPADQPAAVTDTPAGPVADGPYAKALAAARKAGARHANDAGLMALFCANTLQHLVGAVSPQLVWEGAQRRGLSTADLRDLCAKDVMAVSDLQWTTG
ncbi:hypothetical protein ACWGJB_38310 [Streptomyces sp. NPDC054813]